LPYAVCGAPTKMSPANNPVCFHDMYNITKILEITKNNKSELWFKVI
jgi:hypothetical protein